MTIIEALKCAQTQLSSADVPDPEQDGLLMLSSLTGLSPMAVRLHATNTLSPQQEQRLTSLLLSRAKRIPLQYLLNEQWFYGLPFFVDARVLIPRQETETLCDLGVAFLNQRQSPAALDLCTGSGAIAVVLSRECPAASVAAADLSRDALDVARSNARRNQATVAFYQGDLFAPLGDAQFDLILSNPPYIETACCQSGLQPEVRQEPMMALDGGADGLTFYRRIARDAPKFLRPSGMIALEVGDGQARAVSQLLAAADGLHAVQIHNDLYGKPRIVSARAVFPT